MLKAILDFFGRTKAGPPAPSGSEGAQWQPTAKTLKERVQGMRAVEAGHGGADRAIVAESRYQGVLRRLKETAFILIEEKPIATFLLAREPENQYDHNAIAVLTGDGEQVGYLSPEDAQLLQSTALEHERRNEVLACSGKLVGDDIIGVCLNLPSAPHSSDGAESKPTTNTLKERVQRMRAIEAGRGRFDQAIVGESHYQATLRRVREHASILIGEKPIATFLLAREPENQYDHNAIAVLTEDGEKVGHLSREDARLLQPAALEHEQRNEVLACSGKLFGDEILGLWLNLPHLSEGRNEQQRLERRKEESGDAGGIPDYESLDVCRDVSNVAALVAGRQPYGRSRPNWVGNRVAAIGEERYAPNLERVSRGKCENGERITFKVLLVPDQENPIDSDAVMVTTTRGDVLGYLSKGHAIRWGAGIKGFFTGGRVVCRDARLHQRTFKSGKRTFYLSVDMTDEEWLERVANR